MKDKNCLKKSACFFSMLAGFVAFYALTHYKDVIDGIIDALTIN